MINFLSGCLQTRSPRLDILSHNSEHLWSPFLGKKGGPHFDVLHIARCVLLALGFMLLSAAWNVVHHAQRQSKLETSGPYAGTRPPGYVASERHARNSSRLFPRLSGHPAMSQRETPADNKVS